MADKSTVNSQITDTVEQVGETTRGTAQAQSDAMAQQIMAHAIGLAMQNAVSQQQQVYALRNAVTSAAARAILESKPDDAMRLAQEVLSGKDVVSTLSGLQELMDSLNLTPSGEAKKAPPRKKARAKKKR